MRGIEVTLGSRELAALEQAMRHMKEEVMAGVAASLEQAAGVVEQAWRGWAAGEQALPDIGGIDKPSSAIAKSIRSRKSGRWHRVVYSNNSEMAEIVNGRPAVNVEYDMKKTHPYGPKSRITQSGKNKGTPYLIVPFRWGTPKQKDTGRAHFANYIPQAVFSTGLKVSKLNVSRILETRHTEQNYRGEDVERAEYSWGGRVTAKQAWEKNAAGMVRMANGSGYYTFRIISAKSPAGSWIYRRKQDAKAALDVVGALIKATGPQVEAIIEEGIAQSIEK